MTKSKKIIIAVVAILVVLGGTFAGLWFFTDVLNFLKPADEVFSNQLEKALNVEGANFSDYSDFLKNYKEYAEKPYSFKMDISGNINISDVDKDVAQIINKSKITLEQNTDISNKKMQNKIGLSVDNSDILTLDIVANDSKFGIGCEDLYDKYLTVTGDDITKLLKETSSSSAEDVEEALSSLSNINIDPYELLYISDEDLKHFDETYRDALKTFVPEKCYSSEKNVKIDVDGDEKKTTAYYLTLTGKDCYEFFKAIAEKIKDDEVIAKIISEKANMLLESTSQEKISEEDVKDMLNEAVNSLLSEMEELNEEDNSALQIAIYSKNNKPVRIDVNMLEDEKDDDKETLFSIEFAENKTIYSLYSNNKVAASVVNEYSKNTKEEKIGSIALKASGMEIGKLNYELINKDDESKIKLELNVPLAEVSATIDFSTKGNPKKEEVTFNGKIAFEYKGEGAELNLNGTMKFGEANIPELNSSNSVEILNLSSSEQQKILNEISTKAAEVLPKRLQKLGIDMNSLGSSTSLPNLPTSTSSTPSVSGTDTLTATKTTTDDSVGTMKETLLISFLNNKISMVTWSIETDSEDTANALAKTLSGQEKGYRITQSGNRVTITMDPTAFADLQGSEVNASKEAIKAALTAEGYTVK